jgi:hypothetical protein
MKVRWLTALITLLLIGAGAGSAHAVSEAAAPSLIIPPGARADGLGQAYAAIADDGTAMYWNPAGLAGLKGKSVSLMHSQLIPELASDVYYEFLGYTQDVEGLGTLGMSVTYLTYGKWTATDPEGNNLGEYGSYEISIGASYGAKVHPNLWAGVSLKWIRESLVPEAINDLEQGVGTSFAVDAGLLHTSFDGRLRLGVSVQNIGPDLSFIDSKQSAPLPRNLRMGVATEFYRSELVNFLGIFEMNKPLIGITDDFGNFASRDLTLNGGIEANVAQLVGLRWGRIHDPDGDIRGNTWGGGLTLKNYGIRFDYATVPKAQGIGREDKFSLTLGF